MIIDIIFFVAILLFLQQLSKRIAKKYSAVDVETLNEFKRIMAESQEITNRFITLTDNNVRALNKLIRQLDDKQKTLVMLLEEAEGSIKKLEDKRYKPEMAAPADRYDGLVQMAKQGMSREEISKQSGFTEGEIDLAMEISRTRTGKA